MKVLFSLFVVGSLFSSAAKAAGPLECVQLPDFRYDAGALITYALVKEGCTMNMIVSGGKSEKYEVGLCQKETQLKHFVKLDDPEPKLYKPHTNDCPRPLAMGDKNSAEDYSKARKRIWEIFAQVQETYGLAKPDELLKAVDVTKASSELKMACVKALLTEYLDKCMAMPEQKKEVPKAPPIDPNNIPPGIHPESIPVGN